MSNRMEQCFPCIRRRHIAPSSIDIGFRPGVIIAGSLTDDIFKEAGSYARRFRKSRSQLRAEAPF